MILTHMRPHADVNRTRGKHTTRNLIWFLVLLAFVLPVAWIFYWGAWGRWPRIHDPLMLVNDCHRLCEAHGTREGTLLDRSRWPETIRRLGPVGVLVERDNVDIRISGGGIGAAWGYLVVPQEPHQVTESVSSGLSIRPTSNPAVFKYETVE